MHAKRSVLAVSGRAAFGCVTGASCRSFRSLHASVRRFIYIEAGSTLTLVEAARRRQPFHPERLQVSRVTVLRCSSSPLEAAAAQQSEIDRVSSFKAPSFQDRITSAVEAKKKALEQLRSRPPLDEKVAAERQAKRLERERRDRERAAAKKAAQQELKAAQAAEAAAKAASAAPRTEAQLKAARDARYAARKARK